MVEAEEINTHEIKRKSFLGVVALTSRTFILQIIALVATFVLTILLDPSTFGIFYIVTAIVNFLNYFSDIGLAAALIQKKEEPTVDDLATTFTIQQLLVGISVVVALFFSRNIAQIYNFGPKGLFLFRALVISFFLSSLKTIPSVLLERKLDFQKLVIPQVVETIIFYITAITLAFKGFGVASFAWAALARGISGTSLLYIVAPWMPTLKFERESAKKLLAFGIPYQTNSFLALVKDDLLTAFLGTILPLSAIGYIGWAKKWAEIALRLIMDNIIKVTFPTYARLQHHPELLGKAIRQSLLFLALLTFPIAIGMMFMIKPFIGIVPRYSKWDPALMSFYLFTISSVLATLSSPLFNALNAVGKVKYTFYMMLVWTTLTWTLIPVFVKFFGFNGVAMASVLIGLTSFMPYFFIRKIIKTSLWQPVIKPIIATLGMSGVLWGIMFITTSGIIRLIGGTLFGLATYIILIYLLMGKELLPYLAFIRNKRLNDE